MFIFTDTNDEKKANDAEGNGGGEMQGDEGNWTLILNQCGMGSIFLSPFSDQFFGCFKSLLQRTDIRSVRKGYSFRFY